MVCDIYGGERGRIDYLTEGREPGTCFVLRGEPNVTEDIINSLDFRQRFLSGVIAWHPQDTPSKEQQNEVMDLYEKHFSRGQNLNFLWVKHTDKGRAELHFVIPQIELDGGRQFQPYYHGRYGSNFKNVDFARFANLSEALNIRYNWKSGIDPRTQLHSAPDKSHYKQSSRDFKESMHCLMKQMFYFDALPDRNAVISLLERRPNLKIVKVTKHSISVLRSDDQKPIRLKGLWFEEDYSPAKIIKSREFAVLADEEKQKRADELLEAAQLALSKRMEADRIRYKPKPELILKPKINERTPIRTPAPDLPFAQELYTANRAGISRGKQEYLDGLREKIEQSGETDTVSRIIELSVECSTGYKEAAKLAGDCSKEPAFPGQQPERGDHAIAIGGGGIEKGAEYDGQLEEWAGLAQQSSDVAAGWSKLAESSAGFAGDRIIFIGELDERIEDWTQHTSECAEYADRISGVLDKRAAEIDRKTGKWAGRVKWFADEFGRFKSNLGIATQRRVESKRLIGESPESDPGKGGFFELVKELIGYVGAAIDSVKIWLTPVRYLDPSDNSGKSMLHYAPDSSLTRALERVSFPPMPTREAKPPKPSDNLSDQLMCNRLHDAFWALNRNVLRSNGKQFRDKIIAEFRARETANVAKDYDLMTQILTDPAIQSQLEYHEYKKIYDARALERSAGKLPDHPVGGDGSPGNAGVGISKKEPEPKKGDPGDMPVL